MRCLQHRHHNPPRKPIMCLRPVLKHGQVVQPFLTVRLRFLTSQLRREKRTASAVETIVDDILGKEGTLCVGRGRQAADVLVGFDRVV